MSDKTQFAEPEALFKQAFDFLESGHLEEAIKSFDQVIALVPGAAAPYIVRGDALQVLERYPAAIESYDQAIELDANVPEVHCNRGVALHKLGEFEAAVASYDRAVALDPGQADAWSNRGNSLRKLGSYHVALASYDRAIALNPEAAEVYANRAGALEELNRQGEAFADYEKAFAIAPDYHEAQQHLLWLTMKGEGDPARIEQLANEVAARGAHKAADALRARKTLTAFRIQHDLEQTEYLLQQGYEFAGLTEAKATFAALQGRSAGGASGASVTLTDSETDVLASFYEQVMRYSAPALSGPCLNTGNDWAGIEDTYFKSPQEIVVIDDLLSPEAWNELRNFCLVSTVWRRDFENQYFGSFSDDGFVSPLHLQIAAELQQKMPRLFGGQLLEQLWSFKYTSEMGRGINVHADFARLNLNFWITPDEANLDPKSGGMIVYDKPAPETWTFAQYNSSSDDILKFLKSHNASAATIPYKCNRAVLFNSNLFHETDAIRFKTGYENRRINVTYLFGKRFQ